MTGVVAAGIGTGTVIMPPIATQLISEFDWSISYLIIGFLALVVIVVAAQFVRHESNSVSQPSYDIEAIERVNSEIPRFIVRQALRTRQFWMFSLGLFSFFFCQQVVLVHIVPYATDIGISAVSAASILSFIGGLSITGRISLGSASDKIGSKSAWLISLASVAVAFFWLLLVARDLWAFYLFAVIFGFGYGGAAVLQSPLVADLYGLRSHGSIYGMVLAVSMIGGAIGPVAAGRIFDVTGSYLTALLIAAIVGVLGLILALLLKFSGKVYNPGR